MLDEPIIRMENIIKRFYIGQPNELEILHGIDLSVQEGEFISIVGESGSGKSTLMNIIGVLDRQTEGEYYLEGQDVNLMDDTARSIVRNKKIGFVFQNFNLIPRANALKNVTLPLLYSESSRKARIPRSKFAVGAEEDSREARIPRSKFAVGSGETKRKDTRERGMEMLRLVGMEDRATHLPNELSGGQKQRIAIARAMINDPSIILADEPTGALDSQTGHMIMDIFHRLHEEQGKTIVLITHSKELAAETQRIVTLTDGLITSGASTKWERKSFWIQNVTSDEIAPSSNETNCEHIYQKSESADNVLFPKNQISEKDVLPKEDEKSEKNGMPKKEQHLRIFRKRAKNKGGEPHVD